jgi:hypothetical protein
MKTKIYDFIKRLSDAAQSTAVMLISGLIGLAIFPSIYFAFAPVEQVRQYYLWLEMAFTGMVFGIGVYVFINFLMWFPSTYIELFLRKKEYDQLKAEEWEFLQLASGAVAAMPEARQEHYWNLLYDAMQFRHPIGPADEKQAHIPVKN